MDWKVLPLAGSHCPAKRSWQELSLGGANEASTPVPNQRFWQQLSETRETAPTRQKEQHQQRDWQILPVDSACPAGNPAQARRRACVTASHWQGIALTGGPIKELNKYEENALDEKRILKVLPAGCTCKRNCLQAFTLPDVLGWCKSFHLADEEQQRHFFFALYRSECDWSEQNETISGKSARTELVISGWPICIATFCNLLGIGRKRFYRLASGEPDMRRREAGPKATFCYKQLMRFSETFTSLLQNRWLWPSMWKKNQWLEVCLLLFPVFRYSSARLCQKMQEP